MAKTLESVGFPSSSAALFQEMTDALNRGLLVAEDTNRARGPTSLAEYLTALLRRANMV